MSFLPGALFGGALLGEAEPEPFTTDWKSAGTGANDASVGDHSWSNPGNITASDNSYAQCDFSSVSTSQILRATNFGFDTDDVPEGATILGIEVGIERTDGAGDQIFELLVRLRTSSGQTGDDKSNGDGFPSSDAEKVYGASDDDWSAGLSDSDIRSSGFGVDFRAERQDPFNFSGQVDHIRIRVHGLA